ncbi:MAG: peroxiredoxin [Candidatus Bathyarchaeia archaeon]
MVEIGDKAPNFTLPSTTGDKVSLSDYQGKKSVVVAFYVLDWTPVCHGEMCSFRDNFQSLQQAGAEVLGISVDSPFSHKEWTRQLNLTYPLLSDFNKDASKAYDVLYDELLGLKGISKRSVFIVDKQGIIRYKWVSEDPKVAPDTQRILEELKKLP